MTDAKLIQYYALYTIFTSTSGVVNQAVIDRGFDFALPWINRTGWEENDVDPCDGWKGVFCQDDLVVDFVMSANRMTGFFPDEIELLGDANNLGAGKIISIDLFRNSLLQNTGSLDWVTKMGPDFGKYLVHVF